MQKVRTKYCGKASAGKYGNFIFTFILRSKKSECIGRTAVVDRRLGKGDFTCGYYI